MVKFSCLINVALFFAGSTSAFTHPGLLHTEEDFFRAAEKVKNQEAPWYTDFQKIENSRLAQAGYQPRPSEYVTRGGTGENYRAFYNDVAAAYQLAVRWKMTGNSSFADASINVLNAWGKTLKVLNGTADRFLAAGFYGYEIANAAEIMATYDGWAKEDQDTFKQMLLNVFTPEVERLITNHNDAKVDHYWANWDLCVIAAELAIGVLTDNQTMYDFGLDYFKNGPANGCLNQVFPYNFTEDGTGKLLAQGQEAGRDQGHATLDFGLLGVIAQQAYNQGDDLFAEHNSIILAGSEYNSKYNVGQDVPYTHYSNSDFDSPELSSAGRGNRRPSNELLFAHYNDVKGLDASWTKQYRDMVNEANSGSEGGSFDYGTNSGAFDLLGYGSLMYRRS